MYRQARKDAGLTLEEAAWRLNVAPRTLGKYESGELRVPPEVTIKMGQVYNKPELPLQHCGEKCAIGRIYSPKFKLGNIESGTLKLIRELQDVNERMNALVRITEDGCISKDEWPEFEAILKELSELGEAIDRMKLLGIKQRQKEGQAA